MLRINLEVTKTPTRLEQIEEIVVHNTGRVDDGEHVYDVYRDGRQVGRVNHYRGSGALVLAHRAIDAVLESREREASALAADLAGLPAEGLEET